MTNRILAIGDIHGCSDRLDLLLDRIDIETTRDTIVILGDYIDRGPDARGVIDRLLDLKQRCPNLVCLQGNHESMFLNFYLRGRDEELFLYNSGLATLESYGLSLADARAGRGFPEHHLHFLLSLPLFHDREEYFFVHAGLRPGIPLARQSPDDLLWIRSEFFDARWDFGKTVVFGHTPFQEPLLERNKIGIDTGAVYGGRLTCIELPSRRVFQV